MEVEFLAYLLEVLEEDYAVRKHEKDGLDTAQAYRRQGNSMWVAFKTEGEIRTFKVTVQEVDEQVPEWIVEKMNTLDT